MNIKKLLISAAAGALMFGSLAIGAFAAGPTCAVPSVTYPTIQSAATDPTCTTINVATGTYNENVAIAHSLTLNGAKSGVDARGRSGSESIINGGALANITITADGVTVDGFTLNGTSNSGTAAIVMQTANTGETIQNNIVNNPGRAASITTSNTVFRKNAVNNTFATATDGFQANTTPVHDVTFSDNSFSGANGNIYNADITIIEGNSNIVVSGNSGNGDGTLIALFKTNGAQITGNTIVGDGASSAIYIGGANSNITVSGNKVSSAGSAVKVANAFGDGVNSNVTITGNTLNNNQYGVNVAANSENSTVTANRNSIKGNTVFGISNDPASGTNLLDGKCNWWGAVNGPGPVGTGTGDKVTSNVTFTPWLTTSNLNGPCNGPLVGPPTNKDQCKNDGWKTFNNPTFKNQGQCVSFVENHKDDNQQGNKNDNHDNNNHGDNNNQGNNNQGDNNNH